MRKILAGLEVAPDNRGLLAVINFAFFTSGIMAIMLGVLLPYIRAEYSLSYTQSGLMFSGHQLGNFCAVLAAGVLPYVLGRKKSTLLMGAGTALGLILIVAAQNPWLLMIAFILTGIGRGTMSNICNVVIADISGNRAVALNVLHSVFATGALISPVIVFLYVSAIGASGWKPAALTAASLAIIALALISRSKLPDTPAQKDKDSSRAFLKKSSFWIPTLLLLCYLAVETSIIGWFVTYFIDVGILPAVVAGFVPAMFWLMMMTGRLSVAFISKRIQNKNRMLLTMALLTTFCFIGLMLSGSPIPTVIFLLGIGLGMAGIYPTTMATMSGITSTVSVGFTVAIASLGGIFMPGIVGAVADSHGIANGIAMLLSMLIGMVALVILKIITERRVRNETC